jgi:hypothetical protein
LRNAKGALSWAPFAVLDLVDPPDCRESRDSALGSAATTGEVAAVAVAGHTRPEGVHQVGDGRRAVAAGGLVDLILDAVFDVAPVLDSARLEVRVIRRQERLRVLSRERADRGRMGGVLRCKPDRRLLSRPLEVAG